MDVRQQHKEYNLIRPPQARGSFCHAPSVNLNFDQSGNVTACCYNRAFVLGKYPENSIEEIWAGFPAEELRQALKEGDLSKGCEICRSQFEARNFVGMRSRHFDDFVKNEDSESGMMPKVMEFETSNICNLECTMCSGHFSSLIRKNREKLPPLVNPYDDQFVEQLKPFLPHIEWGRFLGGEPFLNPTYFKIWDELIRVNPGVKTSITTNGTVLNPRIKDVLENLKPFIVLSIDSLDKTNYEAIRKRSSFEKVMDNLHYFLDYAERMVRGVNLAVCPMVDNWMDLPALVNFCNRVPMQVYFNTVIWPDEKSMKNLPAKELKKIVSFLKGSEILNPWPDAGGSSQWRQDVVNHNARAFRDVIYQVEDWQKRASKNTRELVL